MSEFSNANLLRFPNACSFFLRLSEESPLFARSVLQAVHTEPERFLAAGERLICYAKAALGEDTIPRLISGYLAFALDVTRSQALYEETGAYAYRSYAEIKAAVYDDVDFMADYHWGMYCTLFCWPHHLELVEFFQAQFVASWGGSPPENLVDLGCGSGIWSVLALGHWTDARATLVDLTPSVVSETQNMITAIGLADRVNVFEQNALAYNPPEPVNALISCFLAAHLEEPQVYFDTIERVLQSGGRAFVTVALTAAECDHIYEFREPSDVLKMVERAGLQLRAAVMGYGPARAQAQFRPRSLALILVKA